MQIVYANAVYDPALKSADELLDACTWLTEWSAAVAKAGATVAAVQRFSAASTIERDGVRYEFTRDSQPPWLSADGAPKEFIDAIARQRPDVVHFNSLIFPQLVAGIRAAVGQQTAIVVQHHGGEFPIRGSGLVGVWQRKRWRNALATADAISFTAAGQADAWRAAGMLGEQPLIEIVEASTSMRAVGRERSRAAINAAGDPLILWVGRRTTSKDPLAVVDGLERALPQLPNAQVVMEFGGDTLLSEVEQRVRELSVLAKQVLMIGRADRHEMPNYYGAADIFVSGADSDGNAEALIEAMSAGLIPIVTDIPVFRAMIGEAGTRWAPGDSAGFASALVACWNGDVSAQKAAAKRHFDRALSWEAIAQRTVRAYAAILSAKRQSTPP